MPLYKVSVVRNRKEGPTLHEVTHIVADEFETPAGGLFGGSHVIFFLRDRHWFVPDERVIVASLPNRDDGGWVIEKV